MYYVTNGYNTKQFESKDNALQYIVEDVEKHKLSYKQVFNKEQNGVQVIVFQYWTLYMESYTIHQEMDLRNRRI